MNNFETKVDALKVTIDLLGLDIENLKHPEKREAIEALEKSLLSLIEIKSNASVKKIKGKSVPYFCASYV